MRPRDTGPFELARSDTCWGLIRVRSVREACAAVKTPTGDANVTIRLLRFVKLDTVRRDNYSPRLRWCARIRPSSRPSSLSRAPVCASRRLSPASAA